MICVSTTCVSSTMVYFRTVPCFICSCLCNPYYFIAICIFLLVLYPCLFYMYPCTIFHFSACNLFLQCVMEQCLPISHLIYCSNTLKFVSSYRQSSNYWGDKNPCLKGTLIMGRYGCKVLRLPSRFPMVQQKCVFQLNFGEKIRGFHPKAISFLGCQVGALKNGQD